MTVVKLTHILALTMHYLLLLDDCHNNILYPILAAILSIRMAARPRDITITHIFVPIPFVLLPAKSFISYSRPVPEPTELSSPKI